MKKYIHIYVFLLKLNWLALLTYRANFINSLVGSIGWGVVSILGTVLLTARISTVYGWTRNELLLVAGMYSILIGIFHSVFSRNFENFSRIIHYGKLDAVLIKPIDSQFFLSCSIFAYTQIVRTLIGIFFVGYMMQTAHMTITILGIIYGGLLLISGILLLYSVWYCTVTITIWFTNLTNLIDFLYNSSNIGRYPPEMIQQAKNFSLYILLPVSLIATIPTKALLLKATFLDSISLLFFTTILFFLSRKFWHFALRFYTSASG